MIEENKNMSDIRDEVCSRKMGNAKVTTEPELKTIPLTIKAFEENVRRADIQTAIRKLALDSSPPSLDATKFGRTLDEAIKSLTPVTQVMVLCSSFTLHIIEGLTVKMRTHELLSQVLQLCQDAVSFYTLQ